MTPNRNAELDQQLKELNLMLAEYDRKITFEEDPRQREMYRVNQNEVRKRIRELEQESSFAQLETTAAPKDFELTQRIKTKRESLAKNLNKLSQLEAALDDMPSRDEEQKIRDNIAWVEGRIRELRQEIETLETEKNAVTAPVVNGFSGGNGSNNGRSAAASLALSPLELHYSSVIELLGQGRVIPILGSGVNRFGRPEGVDWQKGHYPPCPDELADYLAAQFNYPKENVVDLARVARYATVLNRTGPVLDRLRPLLRTEFEPNRLHRFFAGLPQLLKRKGFQSGLPAIVTTNYDDLLERAFDDSSQAYDLLSYVVEDQGHKFLHRPPFQSDWTAIDDPGDYRGLKPEQRPVILKMYGDIELDKFGYDDSLVITEDQFINYMTGKDTFGIPAILMRILLKGSLLFLGYDPNDWSLRVSLFRIWGERENRRSRYASWAVEENADELDAKFWDSWDVEVVNVKLETYLAGLIKRLEALPDTDNGRRR